jgi:hypothetical protein
MGKRIAAAAPAEEEVGFGERLTGLRKAAGFTKIATVPGVSIDEMFGRSQKRKLVKQEGDSRLAIETLDVADKRQVPQVIDAFIERGPLRRKAESRA